MRGNKSDTLFFLPPTVYVGRKYFPASKKLDMVSAAELCENVLGTARVNNVQPN